MQRLPHDTMGKGETPPGGRSYHALFRDSRTKVGHLYRHLSGRGLTSLDIEAESIRTLGRTFERRVTEAKISTRDLEHIRSSVRWLEKAIDMFEVIIHQPEIDMEQAYRACQSIEAQVGYLGAIARELDIGTHGSFVF